METRKNHVPESPQVSEFRHNKMKRLLGIFELSKNEQRVVLIVMVILLAVAFVGYQRRVHRQAVQLSASTEAKPSPTASEADDD